MRYLHNIDWNLKTARFLSVLVCMLTACTATDGPQGLFTSSTISPDLQLIFDAAIQLGDLPVGWRRGGAQIEDEPGAEGRLIWFNGTADDNHSYINVGEWLLLYDDVTAAIDAYPRQSAANIPPNAKSWIELPELELHYLADEMKVACLPGIINGDSVKTCVAIGRYDRLITIVSGNVFEERWLTLDEFRAVLIALDQRAHETMTAEP